jgi:hypothetical protein
LTDERTCTILRDMQNTIQILFEHPQWQLPLFETLKRRNIPFYATDLKTGVLDPGDFPLPRLVLNQASPSAYLRGNTSAVPFALAWMQSLEARGVRVLNGSAAFLLELSKSYQLTLLQGLGLAYPPIPAVS